MHTILTDDLGYTLQSANSDFIFVSKIDWVILSIFKTFKLFLITGDTLNL